MTTRSWRCLVGGARAKQGFRGGAAVGLRVFQLSWARCVVPVVVHLISGVGCSRAKQQRLLSR